MSTDDRLLERVEELVKENSKLKEEIDSLVELVEAYDESERGLMNKLRGSLRQNKDPKGSIVWVVLEDSKKKGGWPTIKGIHSDWWNSMEHTMGLRQKSKGKRTVARLEFRVK